MKIKQTGLIPAVIAFCAAAVILLPYRTYQFFSVIEPGTGFFAEYSVNVWLFYALMAVAVAACVIISLVNRKSVGYDLAAGKRPGQGILSLLVAASLVMDCLRCAAQYSELSDLVNLEDSVSVAAPKVMMVQAIAAVVGAVYFALAGVTYLIGKHNASRFKILSLSPVLWCILRLIFRFTRTISYVRVSDLLLELAMISFLMLFFMAYAQLNAGIDSAKLEWKIAGYGLPAALLSLTCFVPRFIVTVSGNAARLYALSPAEYCDFAIALLLLCIVLTRCCEKSRLSESEVGVPVPVEQAPEGETSKEN